MYALHIVGASKVTPPKPRDTPLIWLGDFPDFGEMSKPSSFARTRVGFWIAGFAVAGALVWPEVYGNVIPVIHSHTLAASAGSFELLCTIIELPRKPSDGDLLCDFSNRNRKDCDRVFKTQDLRFTESAKIQEIIPKEIIGSLTHQDLCMELLVQVL